MKRRIAVTGASGLLGYCLSEIFSADNEVTALYHEHPVETTNCVCRKLDITDEDEWKKFANEFHPDVIIHSAAVTNVDFAEKNRGVTRRVNVTGTENISKHCGNTKLVYISTDFVFDGNRGDYTEDDAPNPINYYAKTKLEGECAVTKYSSDFLIVRTTIFGWNPASQNKKCFAERIVESLEANQQVNAFSDQYFSPILTNELASAVEIAVENNLKGIYNICSPVKCSKHKFALDIADTFGFDNSKIKETSFKNLKNYDFAPRPVDSSLTVSKYERDAGTKLPHYTEGIRRMYKLRK